MDVKAAVPRNSLGTQQPATQNRKKCDSRLFSQKWYNYKWKRLYEVAKLGTHTFICDKEI